MYVSMWIRCSRQNNNKTTQNMRVLIVDDQDIVAHTMKAIMLKLGHEVVVAKSGSEGMRCLDEDPEIRVILSDVECSSCGQADDGPWLARKILEKYPAGRPTPVVFMTAAIQGRGDELAALSGYEIILKSGDCLMAKLETIFRRVENDLAGAGSGPK